MTLKTATQSDANIILELMMQCAREEFLSSPDSEAGRREISKIIDDGFAMLVVEDDSVIGFMLATVRFDFMMGKMIACDRFLYTLPTERGNGVAGILQGAFVGWAKAHGCDAIQWTYNRFTLIQPDKINDDFLKKWGYIKHGIQLWRDL